LWQHNSLAAGHVAKMQDLTDFLDEIQLNRDACNQLPVQIKSLYSQQAAVQLAALESLITFAIGSYKVKSVE
jgi:hypothetical protein